jgi:hypothetical protein
MMVAKVFLVMLLECVGAAQEHLANCVLSAKEKMSGYPRDYHSCVTGQVTAFLG